MRRSIRWRLQAWYALVLLAVVAGFAAILYGEARAARFHAVDASLETAARYLDANLRRLPPPKFDDDSKDGPPFVWKDKGKKKGPPFPPPKRERILADLEFPRATPGAYFAVWRPDGAVLKANGLPADVSPPDLDGMPPEPEPVLRERDGAREAVMRGPHGTRILVGRPVAAEEAELAGFAWRLAGAGALVLAVGLAGGWLVSARILRPVAAISATASAISGTNLSGRIDTAAVDRELAGLAGVLNAMFDRLEAAFARQTRFTADASHELRTPLAVIRTHAELALARPRTPEEYRETAETCLRAARRMTALVEGLLVLARADAGRLDLEGQRVDLRQVTAEMVGLMRPLADGKGVTLDGRLEAADVRGDPVWLGQVVTNLLSNAVQYNRPGGSVRVELGVSAEGVMLSVADTGCGIPTEDRPHLFERFYRVDKARSRASGGNGLGLAICRSIVEAHGGRIGFQTEVDAGSTFWVWLPCWADQPEGRRQKAEGRGA
jgi:heavy metal sensor kinase